MPSTKRARACTRLTSATFEWSKACTARWHDGFGESPLCIQEVDSLSLEGKPSKSRGMVTQPGVLGLLGWMFPARWLDGWGRLELSLGPVSPQIILCLTRNPWLGLNVHRKLVGVQILLKCPSVIQWTIVHCANVKRGHVGCYAGYSLLQRSTYSPCRLNTPHVCVSVCVFFLRDHRVQGSNASVQTASIV